MTQAPTPGRVVHYRLSVHDVEQIDRTIPQHGDAGGYLRNSVAVGYVYPAQVVRGFGGTTVNIVVQLDGPFQYWATSRTEGDAPGQWFWPPRV